MAVGVAIAIAFAIAIASASGPETATGRLGGDYPAFYTAGKLVVSDQRDDMYDFALQQKTQQQYQPPGDDGWLFFPYPPYVALAYAPLTLLPYEWSYALYAVLGFGALVLALHLVRPMLAIVDRHFGVCVIGALAFYPVYRGITGGQNTALTLLLIAWAWRASRDGHQVAAGLSLGLLLYKPQFALPLIGLQLLARRYRTVAAAAGVGAAGWIASAALIGPGWVTTWWRQVDRFSAIDDEVNRHNVISWPSLSRAALGTAAPGFALALATAAIAVWIWRRGVPAGAWQMAATMPALLLLSPHALFYDAGLLVISLGFLLSTGGRAPAIAAIALWAASITDIAKSALGFTPVFAVTLAIFALLLTRFDDKEMVAA